MLSLKVYETVKTDVAYVQDKMVSQIQAKSRIMEYLQHKPSITNQETQELCGFNKNQTYYILHQMCKEKTTTRSLNDLDILVREPELANTVKKVMSGTAETDTVSTIVSNDTSFGIPTNPKTRGKNATVVYEESTPEHNVKLLYLDNMVRTIAYVSRESIKKNAGDIDCPKVFIPEAAGSGNDPYVVGKPEYIGETAVCSQTFLYVAFKTEMEAKNFISYLKTRFFRVLVSACKISQHTPSSTYRFVPLQDFSKSWTDEELYKKYELTEDEITFIESAIRVME